MPSASSINKFFLLGLTIVIGFVACQDKAKKAVVYARHPIPPEEADSVVSFLSEGGMDKGVLEAKIKGKLSAPYMQRFQRSDSPYTEFPRTLHVDFYQDSVSINQKPVIESKLDARYGKYLNVQNKVYLRDSVVVRNVLKGDTIHCQDLWWDQHTGRFSTDKPVRIYTKDKILFGTGMDADQNFRDYRILHLTGQVMTSGNNIPK
jgi:LPS export ABC transporter protein LptC